MAFLDKLFVFILEDYSIPWFQIKVFIGSNYQALYQIILQFLQA